MTTRWIDSAPGRGGAAGRADSRSLNLGAARGLVFPIGLWILPEPWKTQTPRFPPFLGRRAPRAAHRLHRPDGC